MNKTERSALRAALRVYDRLSDQRWNLTTPHLPETAWNECRRLIRLIEKADTRGWRVAERRLHNQLRAAVDRFRDELTHSLRSSQATDNSARLLKPEQIYHEILALHQEFDSVICDLQVGIVAVTTDAIVLEGINLGRFEIRLDWNDLGLDYAYEVVAVDERPAASSPDTTHPHVQNNRLCEGDGRPAIHHALNEGRMGDFFAIVNQILNTYNPNSAYVSLEQWDGAPCSDCGSIVLDDEAYTCRSCSSMLCGDCGACCASCDDVACAECLRTCQGCDSRFCSSCLSVCTDCDESFCTDCLTEERCPTCHEQMQEEQNAEENCDEETATPLASTTASPDATVQPHSVGQVGLSAG